MTFDERSRERVRRATEQKFGLLFWLLVVQDVLLFVLLVLLVAWRLST